MEKLTFDLVQKRWVLQEWEEPKSPDKVSPFRTLLEMFKTGEFFYVLFSPEQKNTTFCSNGVQDLLGLDVEDVDFTILFDLIHPDDQNAVEEFECLANQFYQSLPANERWNYKTRYNFRIRTKYGRFKQIMFQSIPYRVMENNEIEHLGIFTNTHRLKSNMDQHLSFIHLKGESSHVNYASFKKVDELPNLSRRELEILKSVSSGYDLTKTAGKLDISTSTLRNHLKHIRKKAKAKSTVHLVAMAKEKKWI